MATTGAEKKGGEILETVFSLVSGVLILAFLVFLYKVRFTGFEFVICVLITIMLIENIKLSLKVDRINKKLLDCDFKVD